MIRLRPSGADEVLIKRVRDWYEPGPGVFIEPQALFSPAQLFTGSTVGAWYDPSDTTTLFQDAAGTLPVTTVEQPVGLMLDKSKGLVLGPELVTNGDFSNGATGWTTPSGWGVSAGVMNKFAGVANALTQTISSTTAKWYRVSATVVRNSGTLTVSIGTSGTASGSISASGAYTWTLLAGSGTQDLYFTADASFAGSIDNISVRELPGNHAFNSSGNSANFPVLSARYNLLTKTEDFSDSNVWTAPSVSVNQKIAPDGTLTADKLTFTAGSQLFYKSGTNPTVSAPGKTVTGAIYVWSDVNTSVTFRVFAWGGSNFDSIEPIIANQWNLLKKSVLIDGSTGNIGIGVISPDANTLYIWGADLRVSNDALNQPAYQRVNTATDYDTVGFKPYLKFNGTNQWLQTNSIDFTYGDKMFVCAGVRHLSNANYGGLVGLGATVGTAGSFLLWTRSAAGTGGFEWYSNGNATGTITESATPTLPRTSVVSTTGDISLTGAANELKLRINGSLATTTAAGDCGTGNYANAVITIGSYNTSNFFNGRLHQLVVAGKQASASEIGQTEAFTNTKTGAY